MKKLMVFKLVVVLVLGLCVNGFCQDLSWKKITDKNELVVGFCAQYPPFEFKNAQGGFEGFDVDLGNALSKHLGVPVKFKDGEWQGLIAGMYKGDYDILITCMGKTAKRMEMVDFSDKYIDLTEVLVVRKDETAIQGVDDLKDKTVGAQMATSSERVLDGIKDRIGSKKTYNYTTEAFLDLKFKRIDALVSGIAYAAVQIKKDPSFKVVGAPLNSTEIGIALPKGSDELASKINQALATVKADGTHKALKAKWLGLN